MTDPKTKRSTMGEDPLADYVGGGNQAAASQASTRNLELAGTTKAETGNGERRPPKIGKGQDSTHDRATFILPKSLMERLKNAVFHTPGLTMTEVGEAALTKAVEELEAIHGGPYPQRAKENPGGRPMK